MADWRDILKQHMADEEKSYAELIEWSSKRQKRMKGLRRYELPFILNIYEDMSIATVLDECNFEERK